MISAFYADYSSLSAHYFLKIKESISRATGPCICLFALKNLNALFLLNPNMTMIFFFFFKQENSYLTSMLYMQVKMLFVFLSS